MSGKQWWSRGKTVERDNDQESEALDSREHTASIPSIPECTYTPVEEGGFGEISVQNTSGRYTIHHAQDEDDDEDFTSFNADTDLLSEDCLPAECGHLASEFLGPKFDKLLDSSDREVRSIWGTVLRDIPWLPIRISRHAKAWLVNAWLAKGAELTDIVDRMYPLPERATLSDWENSATRQKAHIRLRRQVSLPVKRWLRQNKFVEVLRRIPRKEYILKMQSFVTQPYDKRDSSEHSQPLLHPFQLLMRVWWPLKKGQGMTGAWYIFQPTNPSILYKAPEPQELPEIISASLMSLGYKVPAVEDFHQLEKLYTRRVNPYASELDDWVGISMTTEIEPSKRKHKKRRAESDIPASQKTPTRGTKKRKEAPKEASQRPDDQLQTSDPFNIVAAPTDNPLDRSFPPHQLNLPQAILRKEISSAQQEMPQYVKDTLEMLKLQHRFKDELVLRERIEASRVHGRWPDLLEVLQPARSRSGTNRADEGFGNT